jgi:hypothetical protein
LETLVIFSALHLNCQFFCPAIEGRQGINKHRYRYAGVSLMAVLASFMHLDADRIKFQKNIWKD